MLSRIRYIFRETFDSFRRNATLTVASIITAAISLLGVGLTLLSQEGFNNLLAKWEGGVEMIIFMRPQATQDQLQLIADKGRDEFYKGSIAKRIDAYMAEQGGLLNYDDLAAHEDL